VQGQRIANTMGTMCVSRHTLSHDLHPEAAADLGQKAVEIEEPIESLVAPAHLVKISHCDNNRLIREETFPPAASHFS